MSGSDVKAALHEQYRAKAKTFAASDFVVSRLTCRVLDAACEEKTGRDVLRASPDSPEALATRFDDFLEEKLIEWVLSESF